MGVTGLSNPLISNLCRVDWKELLLSPATIFDSLPIVVIRLKEYRNDEEKVQPSSCFFCFSMDFVDVDFSGLNSIFEGELFVGFFCFLLLESLGVFMSTVSSLTSSDGFRAWNSMFSLLSCTAYCLDWSTSDPRPEMGKWVFSICGAWKGIAVREKNAYQTITIRFETAPSPYLPGRSNCHDTVCLIPQLSSITFPLFWPSILLQFSARIHIKSYEENVRYYNCYNILAVALARLGSQCHLLSRRHLMSDICQHQFELFKMKRKREREKK